jgi:hypothetical protein
LNYSLQDLTVVCEREDWKNLLIHIDYYKNSVKKSPVFNIEAMSEQCFMKNYYDYLLSLKLWLKEQLYSNNPNKIVIVQ